MNFKKKFFEGIRDSKDENKSVKELEKGNRVNLVYTIGLFTLFFTASILTLCAFSIIDSTKGVVLVAVYSGLLMNLFAILMVHQSLYIFLRKKFRMIEKEDFEDPVMVDNDAERTN